MDPQHASRTDDLSEPIMGVLCSSSRAYGPSIANEMLEEVCRKPLGKVFSLLERPMGDIMSSMDVVRLGYHAWGCYSLAEGEACTREGR